MRRFLAMVALIILLVVVVTVPFIIWGETRYASFSHQETGITDFLLASLELIGLVVSIAIVVFILYQYFRYRRPYRLVFDAFSNESTLVNKNGDKPLNLSILAKEELVRQFKIIYYELKEYRKQSVKKKQDVEVQVDDVLYSMEDLSRNNIEIYVSVDQIKKSGMVEDLEEVFEVLTDTEDINLMNLVGDIAPKEVTPVMKFIEAIFPPHVIKATGHLQYKRDEPGITFEFVDQGNQRDLLVRTLWWEPSAESKTANEGATNKEADKYIYLLSPAMHWVAIMFWEQKLLSKVPFRNRNPFLKDREDREKRRQARILYLLGALYYAHAEQFQAYKSFFRKLAVEHLYQALTKDSNWYLPYRYLANLYIFKAQEKALETEDELRKNLFSEAFSLYNEALFYAQSMNKSLYTQHRIIIDRALAELVSKDDELIDKAKQEVKNMIDQKDPADYDSAHPEWTTYLYNLAIWYELSLKLNAGVHNAKEEARRYLAYSLARPQSLWNSRYLNQHFDLLYEDGDLEVLQEELRKKLHEKPALATMTGDNFKSEIDMILKMVDQKLGRPVK